MSTATSIEWTDTTWNPVRGCTPVSDGCKNCYAQRQAHRFSGPGKPYEGLTKLTTKGPRWTGAIRTVPELLNAPLRWREPRRVFVNSMSDLFHEDVPDQFIAIVFGIMACAQQHTFQVLTKRPERAARVLDWMRSPQRQRAIPEEYAWLVSIMDRYPAVEWPLPNVWLGTSVENQEAADERISHLLRVPAAVRFLSCEPLLGPVDLRRVEYSRAYGTGLLDSLTGEQRGHVLNSPLGETNKIDWVITGGESGPGARPCNVAWIESIVEQCKAAGVPVFVKQLGAQPCRITDKDGPTGRFRTTEDGRRQYQTTATMLRLRDKKGGDMSEWPENLRVREFPA